MSAWGWLTGGNAESIIDGAKKGLDKAFYTDEEKADADKGLLDWTLTYLKATMPQAVTRRIIAIGVVVIWALLILILVIAGYFDRGDGSYSMFVFDVFREVVLQPFNIILGFYFLTQTVRALTSKGEK